MHEYSLMERVVETIVSQLKTQGVTRNNSVREIHLRVGALDIHSEESFRQAFELLAKDTPLAGATLRVEIVPAQIDCPQCGFKGPCPEDGADGHDPMPVAQCPQCGAVSMVHGGRGVQPIDLLVEEPG